MTQNQIAYWQLQETKRHNLASESLEGGKLSLNTSIANENARHNLVTEQEQHRAAVAQETLGWFNASESARANRARESENVRHNTRSEDLSFLDLSEKQRHNLASEELSWGQLGEQRRHNIETERNAWYGTLEQERHNKQTEETAQYSARESKRHNIAGELMSLLNYREGQRHNMAQEGTEREKAQTQQWRLEWEQWQYDTYGKLYDQARTDLTKSQSRQASSQADLNWRKSDHEDVKTFQEFFTGWLPFYGI